MSNYSNKDAIEELLEVKFDTGKHSKRPKGTNTLDQNGEVLRSASVGQPSDRAVDPNFPSRTTDSQPGICGVQDTDPLPGTSGIQILSKKSKKSKLTSDLKSGHESATQSGNIFSNPSVFQSSVLRTGSNSVVGKPPRDSEPVVDDVVPVTDLRKSSKPKKKAKKAKKSNRDASSRPPFDYLNEADHILLDLEEFDHACPESIWNPRLGSGKLTSNSKWLTGQSFTTLGDKLYSDDTDSDISIDELLAPYLDDTAQANKKTVAEPAESPVVTAKNPHVEKSSTRVKKIRRKMRDPDTQTNQQTVAEPAESPAVTEKDKQVETSSTRVKKIRRKMRDPDTQTTQKTVAEPAESPAVTTKDPQVEKSSTRVKKIRREKRDPDTQTNQKTVAKTSEFSVVTAKDSQVETSSTRVKNIRREMRDNDPQENKQTVAEASEFPAVTTKPQQDETISARREMRDYDPQVTQNLARKEEVRDHFNVPKRRPKKKKQWEVSGADNFIDVTEPISTSEINKEKPRPDIPLPSATLSTNSSYSSISLYEEVAVIHINRKQTSEPDTRSSPSKKPARLPPLQNAHLKTPPKRPARSKPPKRPARQPQLKNAPAKTLHMPRRVPDLDKSKKNPKKSKTDETCSAFSDDEERRTMVFQGHDISEPQGPTPNIPI